MSEGSTILDTDTAESLAGCLLYHTLIIQSTFVLIVYTTGHVDVLCRPLILLRLGGFLTLYDRD